MPISRIQLAKLSITQEFKSIKLLKINQINLKISSNIVQNLVLVVIIILALITRLYKLGEVPMGLNQDEASMLVEARALLETGADRWGNWLPSYFPSWSSGQNVLLSYLTVPFVWIFGSSIWTTRIVSALLGVFGIAIIYKFVSRIAGFWSGVFASLLLLFLPWNFVASRWGLESNILPVFFLLGIFTLGRTLSNNFRPIDSTNFVIRYASSALNYFCLVPFALGLYGYGAGLMVVPIIFFLTLVFYFRAIWTNGVRWLGAMFIFCLSFAPLGLFIVKNYITKVEYSWEQFLPFSAPLLGVTRLEEVAGDRIQMLDANYKFLINGISDGQPWNNIANFGTIPSFLFVFIFIGFVVSIFIFFNFKKHLRNPIFNPNSLIMLPVIWLVACVGNLLLIPSNVNRANVIYIPIIILITIGITKIGQVMSKYRVAYYLSILSMIAIYCGLFVHSYFGVYAEQAFFPKNLEQPFELVKNNKNPTLITNQLRLHYVYILFYTNYPIAQFQKENPSIKGKNQFDVRKVGNFYIEPDYLTRDGITQFDFLLPLDKNPCKSNTKEIVKFQNKDWKIGSCR